MDEEEQKAIWYVLRELLRQGEKWCRDHRSKEGVDMASLFEPLNERQLESHLRHKGGNGQFKPREAIQVKPPPREGRASSLWCKWNFNDEHDCRFYLGIWLSSADFVGFRFEPPEQGDNHNYYHSQPCRTMGFRGEPISSALKVPERNPTWPLPAGSPLELLLCLVVSIHGMSSLRRLKDRANEDTAMRKNRRLRDALDKVLRLQAGAPINAMVSNESTVPSPR